MVSHRKERIKRFAISICLAFIFLISFSGCESVKELKPPEDINKPFYIWFHWNYEGALELDSVNQIMWEMRCNAIGGGY